MNKTCKSILVAGALLSSHSAFAGLSNGEAYSACKDAVKGLYQDVVSMKVMKVRGAKGGIKKVKLRASMGGERAIFSCEVNKKGVVLSVSDSDGSPVAGFTSKAK